MVQCHDKYTHWFRTTNGRRAGGAGDRLARREYASAPGAKGGSLARPPRATLAPGRAAGRAAASLVLRFRSSSQVPYFVDRHAAAEQGARGSPVGLSSDPRKQEPPAAGSGPPPARKQEPPPAPRRCATEHAGGGRLPGSADTRARFTARCTAPVSPRARCLAAPSPLPLRSSQRLLSAPCGHTAQNPTVCRPSDRVRARAACAAVRLGCVSRSRLEVACEPADAPCRLSHAYAHSHATV
jgi:hypothetical protein